MVNTLKLIYMVANKILQLIFNGSMSIVGVEQKKKT